MEQSQVSDAECWKETLLQSASVDEVSVMLQHDLWEVIRLLPEPEQEKFLQDCADVALKLRHLDLANPLASHVADMRWSPAMRDFRDTLAHKHGNSVLRTLRGPCHAGDLISDQKLRLNLSKTRSDVGVDHEAVRLAIAEHPWWAQGGWRRQVAATEATP